jgi:murein DD-endopeptidase MepM/ murein hydrolase activator NlpD
MASFFQVVLALESSGRGFVMFTMWRVVGMLGVGFLLAVGAAYWIFTGPADLAQYPAAGASPYRLPWTAGQTFTCVQSNRGIVSHRGSEQFAYDFGMPLGTELRAARAGRVVRVVAEHDGHGYHWPNNLVLIEHEDGTRACYAHIRKDGSRVRVGDEVVQGQVIALSGHVGNSMMPHLHFHITDPQKKSTIPITFSDVNQDRGIPRMFKRYTSGNIAPAESGGD